MRRDVFQAIADPNRRAIIHVLSQKRATVNEVAQGFDISLPAISKHLRILEECGLVTIEQQGRDRYCEARLEKLAEVWTWLSTYQQFWETNLYALKDYLEKKPKTRISMNQNSTSKVSPTVRVSIEINASAQDIFNAWIDPEKLSHWMFGPAVREEKIIRLHTDARKDGRFSFVVERDGQPVNHIGTYREFSPYTRLVFTWGIESESDNDEVESVVTIDITPLARGCRLQLVHVMDARWADYKERTEKGWTYMLGKLKDLLG